MSSKLPKYDLRNPEFRNALERLGLLNDMKEHNACAKNIQELKLLISYMKEIIVNLSRKNLTLSDRMFLQKEYDNLKERYQVLLETTNFKILKQVQNKLEVIADNKIKLVN
ncbi:MAG: hypothetical protein ACOX3T_08375 [Bdellovibrionota bacterium]